MKLQFYDYTAFTRANDDTKPQHSLKRSKKVRLRKEEAERTKEERKRLREEMEVLRAMYGRFKYETKL